ncbi:MAG: MFS transporter [Dokdonella sp.]
MQAMVQEQSTLSLFSREWRNLSIGAVGLCSMIAFEAIGVATGMPAVAAALDGVPLYALAFAGTLAGSVVAMVWSGQDCDRHGPYRSMALGMLLFALGLLMAGMAASMAVLVAGRVVQGLGVGALVVALYVATARALPAALHPRLFALFSSAWVVPAVIGPAISGWIVVHLGWRWLFLGIVLMLLPTAGLILPPLRVADKAVESPDVSPYVLWWALLAAFASVTLSVSAYAGSLAPLVVSIALCCVVTAAARLLPRGTLRLARGLPTVIALRGINSAAFFLCEAFIPLWLQQQRGWSITSAGVALTGGALCWSIGSHLQSRMHHEPVRRAWLGRGSAMVFAGIAVCLATVLGLLPDWVILVGWSAAGLGVGLALPMLSVLTLKLAPREQQGTCASALQLCAALCTSAALAAGGLLFSMLQARWPIRAFASVFVLALVISATASISAQRAYPAR